MPVHIIWDNSNIWIGGKETCQKLEPGTTTFAFRIHFQNPYDLVLNARQPGQRYFGGSVPPEAEALWSFVRDLGCEVNLLHRIEAGGEQAVDEILHLKIADLLLDVERPETIALLSGNGHTSQFQSSFPAHVERALRKGWEVEVYSWGSSMNHKVYDPIFEEYSQGRHIRLDDFYRSITFIKEGTYYYGIKGGRDKFFQQGRDVEGLSLL